jgi:penicillin-binding protein 1C
MFLRIIKYFLIVVIFCFATCWLIDKAFPLDMSRLADNSTVIYANQIPIHVFHTQDEKLRILTQVNEVDPRYIQALLAREDQYFRLHPGINPFALVRAAYLWIRYGHIISGGSTITMQTARLLEPRPRKISSKIIECFRALQLEWHFSKNEILSIYMTLAPFGGNLEGVTAASFAYFKKSPLKLTADEIALLVALVQSPTLLRPDHHPKRAEFARNFILNLMEQKGLIENGQAQIQSQAQLPSIKTQLPREIPHLAWRLKKQHPHQKKIHTSINLEMQKKIEHLLQDYKSFLPVNANAAILIIDHIQNKPLVYLASRDFYNEEQHGFVDYICAYRSPGSTLKPFIYGFGFDMGLVKPDSYILDERRRFGAYSPRNFDKDIHGIVPIHEALRMSLNIPVVDILNQIGVLRFLGKLKEAGIEPQFPDSLEGPSLAVALGGMGMTLEQLVKLYAALPRGGEVMNLSYLQEDDVSIQSQILSKHASNQITNILTTTLDDEEHPIAMKTGTSYGHRDTLVIGYDQRFVVGIWIGLPNGSPMGPVSSRTLTVPLLTKIFKLLPNEQASPVQNINNPTMTLQNFSAALNYQDLYKNAPVISFPIHETVIELEKDENGLKPLPLTVTGGKRPYTWMINEAIFVTQCWQQKQFWTPQNKGFYTVSVIDADGKTASVQVEIQ